MLGAPFLFHSGLEQQSGSVPDPDLGLPNPDSSINKQKNLEKP
jgi:hypothetical protein